MSVIVLFVNGSVNRKMAYGDLFQSVCVSEARLTEQKSIAIEGKYLTDHIIILLTRATLVNANLHLLGYSLFI